MKSTEIRKLIFETRLKELEFSPKSLDHADHVVKLTLGGYPNLAADHFLHLEMNNEVMVLEKEFLNKGRQVKIYTSSLIKAKGKTFFLIKEKGKKKLVVLFKGKLNGFNTYEMGKLKWGKKFLNYVICPCNHSNILTLSKFFKWLAPKPIASELAFGFGDRIGLATPGHIKIAKKFKILPVLAQQSIRELTHTSRTPQEVMDDTKWAVFQEGYKDGWVADADHLKNEAEIDTMFKAGFTMYTLDISEFIEKTEKLGLVILEEKFKNLPWKELKSSPRKCLKSYMRKIKVGGVKLEFSKEELIRVAVKYYVALLQAVKLNKRLKKLLRKRKFNLEISIDETDLPTTVLEHFFIASELKRLGIKLYSLAPRFVGRFEKAIDYIGDIEEFENHFRQHAILARFFGHKLSIHSGSDKFSVLPIIGRLAKSRFHLKTSGTSWLEALRVIARWRPALFRKIVAYAIKFFEKDKKSYAISTELSHVHPSERISDKNLEKVYLEENVGRQLLHITYGSVLKRLGKEIKKVLLELEEEYYQCLERHFERHLKALKL